MMTTPYEEIENLLADAELEAANAAISELLEKNANDVDALVFNARLLGSTGRAQDAMRNLDKALTLDAKHIFARTFKAAVLYDNGEYDDAEGMLSDVLKADDSVHAAWFNLARCQARKSDFETANTSLDKALAGDAKNAHYLFAKSNVLDELGQGEEAFEILKASVEANPTLERGWYVLCSWLLDMGQGEEALHNLEQAMKIIPDSGALTELMGRAAVETGQPGDAVKLFGKMLDKNPENPGVWFNFGAANLAAEEFAAAEVAFRKTIELDPEDIDALHELANLIQLSEDPSAITEAEGLLNQIIQKQPESWEVHNDLGRLYLSQDTPESKEKGLRCFEKAAEIGGNDPLVVFNLALASAELEDLNRARELCGQLIEDTETPEEIRTRAEDLRVSLAEAK
jgi:tetratricopeptide (TPR) repeat protein